MEEHTSCVVVGGGPAGMMTGLLLARAGIDVVVLEKHADFLRDFRGDTVHPSTMLLLDELGLIDEFHAIEHSRMTSVAVPTRNGELATMADFSGLNVRYPYIAIAQQWDFLDLLARSARQERGFTLRMSTEVTGLVREQGRIVGVRYRAVGGATQVIRADLVIAADGRNSRIRDDAGIKPREHHCPFDAWWFRLSRHPDDQSTVMIPQMRAGRFAVALPRPDFYQIGYYAPVGMDVLADGIEAFRASVARLYPALADRVTELESPDDVHFLQVRVNHLSTWHRDGLLCIGDAAHAMSPVGGCGINLAIQDAVVAASLLAEPLRRGRPSTADLAKVRRRRAWPAAVIQGLQHLHHRKVVGPVLAGLRDGAPERMVSMSKRFPLLPRILGRLLGVGVRQPHIPAFARRSTEPAASDSR